MVSFQNEIHIIASLMFHLEKKVPILNELKNKVKEAQK